MDSSDNLSTPQQSDGEPAKLNAHPNRDPIAIIGIGCRFPSANGPEAFWELLRNGVDAITEIPPYRYDVDTFYDSTPGVPGKIITRFGGFLENADLFDPAFFHISAREALRMDPQQRLVLEVAWEAVEDSGQNVDKLLGSATGVFMAVCSAEYADLQTTNILDMDIYSCAGCARSVLAGRLSYVFGLQGPSVVVDTACSSSLIAVHMACQSIWSGESSLALAGGVNLLLTPVPTMAFSQAGMLSPDGRCKTFDASANGYVRGEGVGVVVLKPLSMAQADRDPIYAVILGSAANNDGRSAGLLAPAVKSQEMVIKDAYRNAGVSPNEVHYVEAHGTGTIIGDYVELTALAKTVAANRPLSRACLIGSVKTNIGHSEAASGIAALIKVALSLKHKAIPRSLHFETPNPKIEWNEVPLKVQQELGPWPVNSEPALAGISSFGLSGTNAHVVLREAPAASAQPEETGVLDATQLLTISAHHPDSLREMAQSYQHFLAGSGMAPSLRTICYNTAKRRKHHDHRLSLVVHSKEEAVEFLQAFADGETRRGMSHASKTAQGRPKVVFVFSGTGSQHSGMAQQLIDQEPVFRDAFSRCDELIRQETGWSLIQRMKLDESWLDSVEFIQPAIFAVQVALTALWRHWGIEADVIVGQSLGEVAGAYVSGAITLQDAVTIICRRARILKKVSGLGGAASVELSLAEAKRRLQNHEGTVSIACSNSPTSTVIAGNLEALNTALEELQKEDIFCRLIKADFAAHSPLLDGLREELQESLNGIKSTSPSVPIYSTVTTGIIQNGELGAIYWTRNLREPALFSPVVEQLVENDHTVFLEVSPHPVLLTAVQETFVHKGKSGTLLPSLKNDGNHRDTMLASLGTLYTLGFPVNWDALYPDGDRCVSLPRYHWQKERFWLKNAEPGNEATRMRFMGKNGGSWAPGHPLLGRHLQVASSSSEHIWQQELDIRELRYLADHCVHGVAVFPAVGWVEAVVAASREAFGNTPRRLGPFSFKRILSLSEDQPPIVQLLISEDVPGEATFRTFSSRTNGDKRPAWTLHATGTIHLAPINGQASLPLSSSIEEIQAQCSETIDGSQFYEALKVRGLEYGPRFQGLEALWRRDGEALGKVRAIKSNEWKADSYTIYPGFLDSCIQTIAATLPSTGFQSEEPSAYLPIAFDRINIYVEPKPDIPYWSHAVLNMEASKDGDVLEGDVTILDESSQIIMEVRGIKLQHLKAEEEWSLERNVDDWLYEIQWQSQARAARDVRDLVQSAEKGSWLIFADDSGVGERLRAQLVEQGENCKMVFHKKSTEDHDHATQDRIELGNIDQVKKFFQETFPPDSVGCHGIIYLWSLDAPSPEESLTNLDLAHRLGCSSVLSLIQALAQLQTTKPPFLWLATNGVQSVSPDQMISLAQSPLWGLGRVILHEHPELNCKLVDLGDSCSDEEITSFAEELRHGDAENQIALRGNERYVARLVRIERPDVLMSRTMTVASEDQPFRVEMTSAGILENLILRGFNRSKPGPGEVEIQVVAAGLNFVDVMMAMGILPGRKDVGIQLGKECSGRIVALGEDVLGLRLGQEVIAIVPHSLSRFVITNSRFVIPKPSHISFEEAVTIPITFLTAYYSLCHIGRLRKGERVLIHAAAGGVGLAAIQIAQSLGAEIYATAGNPEKRELLRSLGVRNVMDSRSLAFAEEIMEMTDGQGVDLVLNSLAGEAIPRSLSVLRSCGRFLEIGKRDIYQNREIGLKAFHRNQSFHAIDLDLLTREQPEFIASMMAEVLDFFRQKTLEPINHQVFPVSKVEHAFRYMAQGKHIGKIVVRLEEPEVRIIPLREQSFAVRSDATYLITGGYGGLGLAMAQWLVESGARHLALLGRRAPTGQTSEILKVMKGLGVEILEAQADVSDYEQLAAVIAEIESSMPPLSGIIHAAGILDDAFLLQLDQARFSSVLAPKINGSWNLHTLTQDAELDFFALFSSATSVLGSPSQGNYAAANSFMDALAHYRRSLGMPAVSINWGAWGDVGLAAQANSMKHLSRSGIVGFTRSSGVKAMDYIMQQEVTQVTAMPVKWNDFFKSLPANFHWPLLTHLAHEQTSGSKHQLDEALLKKLLATNPDERPAVIESYIIEQAAKVLGFSQSRLDPVKPLTDLGLDSLMALEMKNRVESRLGVTLPISALLQGPSIRDLAILVAEQLDVAFPNSAVISNTLNEVMQMSDEEVDALLQTKEVPIEEAPAGFDVTVTSDSLTDAQLQ